MIDADAAIIGDTVLVVVAAGRGILRRQDTARTTVAEARREGVGASRRRHHVAEPPVQIAIEQEARADVVGLDVIAEAATDIDAGEGRVVLCRIGTVLRHGRRGDQRRGQSPSIQNFIIITPVPLA